MCLRMCVSGSSNPSAEVDARAAIGAGLSIDHAEAPGFARPRAPPTTFRTGSQTDRDRPGPEPVSRP